MVIKSMYLKILLFKQKGYSKSEIAQKLNLNRKTIRKYLNMSKEEYRKYRQSVIERQKSFDKHLEDVLDVYEKNDNKKLPIAAVYDYLEEKFGELPGTEKTFRNYIHYLEGKNLLIYEDPGRRYQQVPELAYGKQLQIDFGEYKTKSGLKLYIFAAVLSASRYKYFKFQDKPFTTTDLIGHLLDCFDYIEGMPEEIVIDQDSVMVVSENYGDIIYTKDFAYFIEEMGLKMYVCRKADPETKGKVENGIKYIKYNFLSVRDFTELEEANRSLSAWLVRRANGKISQATKKIPADMFEEEKNHLRALVNSIFRKDNLIGREERTADDKGYISVDSCQYSLASRYKNKVVEIYKTEKQIFVFDLNTGEEIFCHNVSLIPGKKITAKEHRRETEKTVNELKQEVLDMFTLDNWKRIAEKNFKAYPRYVRDQCLLARKYYDELTDTDLVNEAVEFCLKNERYSMKDLFDTYNYYLSFKKQKDSEGQESEGKEVVNIVMERNPVKVATRDIEVYKRVLRTH